MCACVCSWVRASMCACVKVYVCVFACMYIMLKNCTCNAFMILELFLFTKNLCLNEQLCQ